MTRPRRKPAPPGRVEVCCTGRGTHDLVKLRILQLVADGPALRIVWDTRHGAAPETGFRAADGLKTLPFECGTCGRHLRRREDWLAQAALALAGQQGISGDDNTPVKFDISTVERA